MDDIKVNYRPASGINCVASEDVIGATEVRDARNFLFEGGEAFNRPGVVSEPLTSFSGSLQYAISRRFGITPITLVVSSNGKVYKLVGLAATEITGAATTFGSREFHNSDVINGVIMIANNAGGMLRWDTAGNTRSLVTGAKYRYVTSHYSRAIGAYDITSGAEKPRTVGWSIVGDEAIWTGAGSGANTIADATDDITGLGTIRNIIVIARREGFHLAFATGSTLPTFRFETWSRRGPGVFYPSTLVFDDNVAYFCSRSSVHSFNLSEITDIGAKIRKQLFEYLCGGALYRGVVTTNTNDIPRFRYHLVPMTAGCPHFCYDIEEGAWSKHDYAAAITGGWYRIVSSSQESLALFDTSNIYVWNEELACETPAMLRGRMFTVENPETDYKLQRVLVRLRNFEQTNGRLTVNAHLGQTAVGSSTEFEGSSDARSGAWVRAWANLDVVGQDFEPLLEIPAGVHSSVSLLGMRFQPSGGFRG